MKEIGEISRVNYANSMHHKEKLRHQIDPQMIERIEIAQNPSQNYRNVKKVVYQDELEKTVAYHEEKKQQDKILSPYLVEPKYGSLHRNQSAAHLGGSSLYNGNNSNSGYLKGGKGHFTDFDQ